MASKPKFGAQPLGSVRQLIDQFQGCLHEASRFGVSSPTQGLLGRQLRIIYCLRRVAAAEEMVGQVAVVVLDLLCVTRFDRVPYSLMKRAAALRQDRVVGD